MRLRRYVFSEDIRPLEAFGLAALIMLVLVSVASFVGVVTHAQNKPEQSKAVALVLEKNDAEQLAGLAQALSENEQAYKDAQIQLSRAQAVIAQYESMRNLYTAAYYKALATAGKQPSECGPTADKKSIECLPKK